MWWSKGFWTDYPGQYRSANDPRRRVKTKVDEFYELNEKETAELLQALSSVNRSPVKLRKFRIFVSDEGVKFKVNEYVWSPPFGKKVKGN